MPSRGSNSVFTNSLFLLTDYLQKTFTVLPIQLPATSVMQKESRRQRRLHQCCKIWALHEESSPVTEAKSCGEVRLDPGRHFKPIDRSRRSVPFDSWSEGSPIPAGTSHRPPDEESVDLWDTIGRSRQRAQSHGGDENRQRPGGRKGMWGIASGLQAIYDSQPEADLDAEEGFYGQIRPVVVKAEETEVENCNEAGMAAQATDHTWTRPAAAVQRGISQYSTYETSRKRLCPMHVQLVALRNCRTPLVPIEYALSVGYSNYRLLNYSETCWTVRLLHWRLCRTMLLDKEKEGVCCDLKPARG